MSEQKKINKLATIIAFALVIICILGYPLTDKKDEWYWRLINNLIPELLGPLIVVLLVFYFLTKSGIRVFEHENDSTSEVTSKEKNPVSKFGLRITSHENASSVERMVTLRGDFKYIPENKKIRIYLSNENQSDYWINSQNLVINNDTKTWQTTLYVGGETSQGNKYYIIAVLEDDVTDPWIQYYSTTSKELNKYSTFKYPIPKSVIEAHKIMVIRN